MRKYEGSKNDKARDAAGAKKAGMTMKEWEKSAADRRMDKEGQGRMVKDAGRRK